MAHIRGPANGHASLTGTSGDDLIAAFGSANTITGGGGDDTISALHGSDNLVLEGEAADGLTALNESVLIGGRFDTVGGGDENFRVSGYASDSRVTLGRGDETVSLNGTNDFVSVIGGDNRLSVLGGHDTIAIAGQAGSGYTDDVLVSGSHDRVVNSLTYGPYPAIGDVTIRGGSGFGYFGMGTSSGSVVTQGTNNFIAAGSGQSTIVAGSGLDTVQIDGGAGFVGGTSRIVLAGTGNHVEGVGGSSTISGGAGHDVIDLTANYDAAFTIREGGMDNSISLTSTSGATITPGTGHDTVSIDGGVATMTFHGADDTLFLSGTTNYGGYPVATVTDQSTGLNIVLEATDNSPNPYPSVGDLSIKDFDPHGVIDFDGRGGFTSVGQVLDDLKATGNGHYTLVLPDHSGTITFLNTGHLGAANFHV